MGPVDPSHRSLTGSGRSHTWQLHISRIPARCACSSERTSSKPRPDLAARLEREVKARWQPQIRARARKKAATTGGIVIDTRARLGYTAPIGSTDQDRIRHLTVALPPQYAARLFDAQQAGAGDQELQEIAAEALKEVYFQDGGRRAGSLEEVRFMDVEHLEFDL
ncbi:telomere-protecting terminal protein Tpg [Streptomyces sp. NPDC001914]|uniref:telomere-protecting terminal protein Tpg n=1 Tax=Streptomyces sp. NPDC001914 TaxID=3364623 RepID=UPI0036A50536